MVEENVFLRVVEIRLPADFHAWVAFAAGRVHGALVDAVVFEAGLEEDARRVEGGESKGCEERAEDVGWRVLFSEAFVILFGGGRSVVPLTSESFCALSLLLALYFRSSGLRET